MWQLVFAAAQDPTVQRWAKRAPFVIAVGLMAPCACGLMIMSGSIAGQQATAQASTCAPTVSPVTGSRWDTEQASNAAAIVAKGRELGVPDRGIVIALAVAMQESTLRSVDHGDTAGPDSRGLFQQRDSWGPLEIRMSPAGSAGLFFARLLALPGWEAMPLAQAAQVVQRSAFPGEYMKWENEATTLAGLPSSCSGAVEGGWALPLPAQFVVPPMREHHDYPAVDIGVATGTPVYAVTGGTVRPVDEPGGCGTGVAVDSGVAVWMYCHGSQRLVDGGAVEAGTQIMLSGNSGSSTGPHLHVQISRGGQLVCPQPLLDAIALHQPVPPVETLPAGYPCLR